MIRFVAVRIVLTTVTDKESRRRLRTDFQRLSLGPEPPAFVNVNCGLTYTHQGTGRQGKRTGPSPVWNLPLSVAIFPW